MYMNQISACDSDQISAFGFFDINLNLVTSVSTFLFYIYYIPNKFSTYDVLFN